MIWVPFADFTECAAKIDSRTLSIQRFEIWKTLVSLEKGRVDDPMQNPQQTKVMNMWRGGETWLVCYGMACALEWERRNGKEAELHQIFKKYLETADLSQPLPWWIGDATIMASHRSNMIPLHPDYYMELWPGVISGLPLAWSE